MTWQSLSRVLLYKDCCKIPNFHEKNTGNFGDSIVKYDYLQGNPKNVYILKEI